VKIALITEGPFEEKTLKIIARKIVPKETGIESRVLKRGDLFNWQKVCSYIENDIMKQHPDISKVIACIDSECTPEKEIQTEAQRIEKKLTSKTNLPVSYVVVVHALEGWLLSDAESIKGYLGSRADIEIPSSASLECKPKDKMKEIFGRADKQFIHTRDNPRIAETFNVGIARDNNKSFASFCEKVKDP